jgi:hypothetical protein
VNHSSADAFVALGQPYRVQAPARPTNPGRGFTAARGCSRGGEEAAAFVRDILLYLSERIVVSPFRRSPVIADSTRPQ